jgi:hypothetical protein
LPCRLVAELARANGIVEGGGWTASGGAMLLPRVIPFGLCGHGNFDLAAYDAYLAGDLEDPEFSEEELQAALAGLPEAPSIA